MTDETTAEPRTFVPWNDLDTRRRRRLLALQAVQVAAALAMLFAIYAVAPIGPGGDTSIGTLAVLVVGASVFVATLARQIRALGTSSYPVLRAVRSITVIVALFVISFSLGYLALSAANPDAFSEGLTKVTSLYFTVTVLATVGFGDITATNDVARLLVTAQMMLGLGLIGAVVRYLSGLARTIASRRGEAQAGDR
jgi:voltage-gated potassium channel